MTCQSCLLALAFLIVGCSPDADSQTGPAGGDARVPPPTGGPVTAVDGERQRLSIPQMLAYLPGADGRFAAQGLADSFESEESDASGTAYLAVTYEDTEPRSSYLRFTVSLRDMIDEPETMERERREFDQRMYNGRTDGVTAGTAGGLATLEIRGSASGPMLRMLIADRFVVSVQQGGADVEIEDFVAFVESSFVPALATAPAFADAGDPPAPEWAAAGLARSEEQHARGAREREARDAEAAAEREAAGTLPPCDDLLSADDVASVLGAPVRVVPTPGVAEDGSACNRSYRAEGVGGSVILIVSHYRRANQAEGALRVASDHDRKVDLAPLAGGLNGIRYTHDLSPDIHVSHFASGVDFVELKAVAGLDSEPGTTPTQLAAITAIVAGQLGE